MAAKKTTAKKKRKNPSCYIGEEYYVGTMTIEEAFQKAFEPYFCKEKEFEKITP